MPASIVVLPSQDWPERASLIGALRDGGAEVVDVDLASAGAAPLSVRTCAAILAARPGTPMLVVAHGDGAELLPAVSLAQRTAHRAIEGYALLEPDADPSAPDWPDAPVVVIAPEGHPCLRRARLRGWSPSQARDVTQAAAAVLAATASP